MAWKKPYNNNKGRYSQYVYIYIYIYIYNVCINFLIISLFTLFIEFNKKKHFKIKKYKYVNLNTRFDIFGLL